MIEIDKIVEIAKVCHQANKTWCELNDDFSQVDWDKAPDWQRESRVNGVQFAVDNPTATASMQHSSWLKQKIEEGWEYGKVKDADKKTHPCIVPYNELPLFQKKKDKLFKAIVEALK